MKIIESYWVQKCFKQFLSINAIALVLQMFFQVTREMKNLSHSYTFVDLSYNVLSDNIVFIMELAPITIYISGIMVQDQWKKNGYFRNAMLDGMSIYLWRMLTVRIWAVLMLLMIPIWCIVVPSMGYRSKVYELNHQGKQDKIEFSENRLYIFGDFAYVQTEKSGSRILNINSLEQHEGMNENIISQWKKKAIDLKIGADRLTTMEKWAYTHDNIPSDLADNTKLTASLLRDVFYFISLSFSMIYITQDRERCIFNDRRQNWKPRWMIRSLQGLHLYWGIKIMPLIIRYVGAPWSVLLYILFLPILIKI